MKKNKKKRFFNFKIKSKMLLSISGTLMALISLSNAVFIPHDVNEVENVSLADDAEQMQGVNSPTECILRCRRHLTNKIGFYTTNSKCYCLSDDRNMTSGEISGNSISQVSI